MNNKKGISLITLVITICVIILLSLIATNSSSESINNASKSKYLSNIGNISDNLQIYRAKNYVNNNCMTPNFNYLESNGLIKKIVLNDDSILYLITNVGLEKFNSSNKNVHEERVKYSAGTFEELLGNGVYVIDSNWNIAFLNGEVYSLKDLAYATNNTSGDNTNNNPVKKAPWQEALEQIGSYTSASVFSISGTTITGFSNNAWEYSADYLIIPQGITAISASAFKYRTIDVHTLIIPDTVKTIGTGAFKALSGSIDKVYIGSSDIGNELFQNSNAAIQEAYINCETIGSNAFQNVTSLKSLYISSKSIGNGAFQRCSNLSSVAFDEGLLDIGTSAFEETKISTIRFPSTLTNIGNSAFIRCNNLSSVTLNEGLSKIDKKAFEETNISTLTCPSSLRTICNSAFKGCTNLGTINFNNGLITIENNAFANCIKFMNKQIKIPESVINFNISYIFSGVPNVTVLEN